MAITDQLALIIDTLDRLNKSKTSTYGLPIEDRVYTISKQLSQLVDSGFGDLPIHICSSDEYDHTTGIPTVTNPEENIFYLVPNLDPNVDDMFVEYVYVNGNWELFGSGGGSSYTETINYPLDVIFNNSGLIKVLDGSIVEYDDAKYSDPIKVYKNDVINYALGINSTAYCLIAECDESGTFIQYTVRGGTGVITGIYKVTRDMYVRFCGRNLWKDNEYVYIQRRKSITDIVKDMDDSWSNLYASFYKVGIIGDSYSAVRLYSYNANDNVTRVNDSDGNNDVPFYSWGRYLQRWSGMTYKIFATGGLECKTWLTCSAPESEDEWGQKGFGWNYANRQDNYCQAYIICLGINDVSRHDISYVGTEDDINDSDPDLNADTFIGNYAKIIQKVKGIVPQAKFFCVTMPTYTTEDSREKYTFFNSGIRTVAKHFDNCYLIDLYAKYYDMYNDPNGFFTNSKINNHYTPAAFARVAKIISREMSRIMFDNPSEFKSIEYIDYRLWGETQQW